MNSLCKKPSTSWFPTAAAGAFLLLASGARDAPGSAAKELVIEGFTILVDPALEAAPELFERARKELQGQLWHITRKVPRPALGKLRRVRIHLRLRSPTRCAAYHPSRAWLTRHSRDPDLAGCVEIGNARTFVSWSRTQPWMVLHELAHAYHHRFVPGGFANGEVRACWRRALESARYDSVQHVDGRHVRAYALTNPQEFFAEASEAWFGTNDMFPFVRPELVRHDPGTARLLRRLWGG